MRDHILSDHDRPSSRLLRILCIANIMYWRDRRYGTVVASVYTNGSFAYKTPICLLRHSYAAHTKVWGRS